MASEFYEPLCSEFALRHFGFVYPSLHRRERCKLLSIMDRVARLVPVPNAVACVSRVCMSVGNINPNDGIWSTTELQADAVPATTATDQLLQERIPFSAH